MTQSSHNSKHATLGESSRGKSVFLWPIHHHNLPPYKTTWDHLHVHTGHVIAAFQNKRDMYEYGCIHFHRETHFNSLTQNKTVTLCNIFSCLFAKNYVCIHKYVIIGVLLPPPIIWLTLVKGGFQGSIMFCHLENIARDIQPRLLRFCWEPGQCCMTEKPKERSKRRFTTTLALLKVPLFEHNAGSCICSITGDGILVTKKAQKGIKKAMWPANSKNEGQHRGNLSQVERAAEGER